MNIVYDKCIFRHSQQPREDKYNLKNIHMSRLYADILNMNIVHDQVNFGHCF